MKPALRNILLAKFVNLTNVVKDGDFPTIVNWTNIAGITELSTSKNVSPPNSLKCTASGFGAYARNTGSNIVGHIYYLSYWYFVETYTSGAVFAENGGSAKIIDTPVVGMWTHVIFSEEMPNNGELNNQYIGVLSGSMVAYFDNFMAMDLTDEFCNGVIGTGLEPTAEQINRWFPNWFNGSIQTIVR